MRMEWSAGLASRMLDLGFVCPVFEQGKWVRPTAISSISASHCLTMVLLWDGNWYSTTWILHKHRCAFIPSETSIFMLWPNSRIHVNIAYKLTWLGLLNIPRGSYCLNCKLWNVLCRFLNPPQYPKMPSKTSKDETWMDCDNNWFTTSFAGRWVFKMAYNHIQSSISHIRTKTTTTTIQKSSTVEESFQRT